MNLASGGAFSTVGNEISSPRWTDGAINAFNGIWIQNISDSDLHLDSIRVLEVPEGMFVKHLEVSPIGELPREKRGPFTGYCGKYPPDGYPTYSPHNFRLMPTETVLLIVGVANPELKTGALEGLEVTYRARGGKFRQEFYYLVRFTKDLEDCPGN